MKGDKTMVARNPFHRGLFAARDLAIVVALSLLAANAFSQSIAPGKYQSQGYGGYLKIESPNANGAQAFSMESYGANGHTCELEGKIQKNVAIVLSGKDEAKGRCVITFKLKKDQAIEVETPERNEYCRYFCGARAYFAGTYQVPPSGCDYGAVRKKQEAFAKLYESKAYAQALQALESTHRRCQAWMAFDTAIDMDNDLAVVYFHLQRNQECINALKFFTKNRISKNPKPSDQDGEDDQSNDLLDELAHGQPAYIGWARGAIRAARTNLKLCKYSFKN
jgi:hypothetical protein